MRAEYSTEAVNGCALFAVAPHPMMPRNPVFRRKSAAPIIARIQALKHAGWSTDRSDGDENAGMCKSSFEKLRYFRKWPTRSIAYTAPDK
jgi:hypothetical protein